MKSETHLTHLYSLLITLLLTNQTQSRTLTQCSSSCGDIIINYPFRLNTDPSFCGDSDYELSCQNNKTLLMFHSGKYIVKFISYDRRIIRLVDFNLADGKCRLPYGSLSVDDVIEDGRYQGRVANTYTSFVRCESEIGEAAYRKVDCLSGNGSYVYATYDNYIISGLQGPCSFISRVPTIFQAVLNPSYQSIVLLLQEGFELGWSVECRDCIEAGYSCIVKSWDPPFEYDCYSYETGFYIPAEISLVFYAIWDFLIGVNLVARFILAPIVLIGFLVHKYRTRKETVGNNQDVISQRLMTPSRYCYADIVAMTDQFKDKLGHGGSGVVYKGQLPDGSIVAVKMVGDSKLSDEEFVYEVRIIGGIHHGNVTRLLGFCCEGLYRALIFEYMPNGSLDKYMIPKSAGIEQEPFSWEKLLQISLGTAQGIKHLHEGSDLCIIHFDIKPHNVLLDQNFVPKVSDFGLLKFYPNGGDFLYMSTIKGTMGYIAPELISSNHGAASCKSDVYSFGMLLLEIVEGRWKVDTKGKITANLYFPSWLYDHLREGGNLMLENATENESAIARMLSVVGLWCIQKIASDRPSMAKVVEMLEGSIVDLQLPPNSLSFPQYTIRTDPQSDSSTELLISEIVEKSY